MNCAYLSNDEKYTIFRIGDTVIRYKSPYSLEKYVSVIEWDSGYLVVMAKYAHNTEPEEEYIDIGSILDDLGYLGKDELLNQVKEVRVLYD